MSIVQDVSLIYQLTVRAKHVYPDIDENNFFTEQLSWIVKPTLVLCDWQIFLEHDFIQVLLAPRVKSDFAYLVTIKDGDINCETIDVNNHPLKNNAGLQRALND